MTQAQARSQFTANIYMHIKYTTKLLLVSSKSQTYNHHHFERSMKLTDLHRKDYTNRKHARTVNLGALESWHSRILEKQHTHTTTKGEHGTSQFHTSISVSRYEIQSIIYTC